VNTFRELGLRAELADAAAAAGFDAPSPLQQAAIAVLRRGSNTVLLASSGSGVTAAYALALLDRLSQSIVLAAAPGAAPDLVAGGAATAAMEPRALVLTATEDRAAQVARTFATLAGAAGTPVRALTVAWSAHGNGGVLVAPLAAAARALRDSSLKLLELQAVVFDGLPVLLALDDSAAFDSLIAALPHDVQARAGATFQVVAGLSLPVGALVAGPLAEIVGTGGVLWVAIAGALIPLAILSLSRLTALKKLEDARILA